VMEVDGGITVYPARCAGDRWRLVWHEDGRRRYEAVSETRSSLRHPAGSPGRKIIEIGGQPFTGEKVQFFPYGGTV